MPQKRPVTPRRADANMTVLARAFTPTANKRLNELIGFLALVCAAFLVLALVSSSPLDPSLNTAATPLVTRPTDNWVGVFGAIGADIAFQLFGVSAFLLPVFLTLFSLRWFRSRPIQSPWAKVLGSSALVVSVAGLIGLLPWNFLWRG